MYQCINVSCVSRNAINVDIATHFVDHLRNENFSIQMDRKSGTSVSAQNAEATSVTATTTARPLNKNEKNADLQINKFIQCQADRQKRLK